MKKPKLFSHREESALKNKAIRVTNYLSVFFVIACGVSNASLTSHSLLEFIILSIFVSIASERIISKVISETTFFEWDYTERRKKTRFSQEYSSLCVLFCSLFAISIIVAYRIISNADEITIPLVLIVSIPTILFAFNLCNIVSLYFPLFEDDLTVAYKIQKKPENWQEQGKEITKEDMLNEIIERDFGIRVDK